MAELKVDGVSVPGTVLPDFKDGRRHEVEVILKEKDDSLAGRSII